MSNIEVVYDYKQRTPAWYKARRGIPTASNAKRIITPKRGDLSAQHKVYAQELAIERFMDENIETFKGNDHTARGQLTEDEARRWYLDQVGLADLDTYQPGLIVNHELQAACSPDVWHYQNDYGVGGEIKCRDTKGHFLSLLANRNGEADAEDFKPQIQFSMLVCESSMWRLILYNKRLPLVVPIQRDDSYCEALREGIAKVIEIRDQTMAVLQEMFVEVGGI